MSIGTPRHRQTGALSAGPTFIVSQDSTSCSDSTTPYVVATLAGLKVGHTKSMDDVTIHQWNRVKRGNIFFNPLFIYETTRSVHGGSIVEITSVANSCNNPGNVRKAHWHWSGATLSAILNSSTPLGIPEVGTRGLTNVMKQRLVDEVWTGLLAKRGSVTNTNYFESLAEIDKSFAMVHHPLENVSKFLGSFMASHKRKRNRMSSALGVAAALGVFASSEWLRFRYGITPLISDVKAGLKTLRKQYNVERRLQTYRNNGKIVALTHDTGLCIYDVIQFNPSRALWQEYSYYTTWLDWVVPNPWDDLGLTFKNLVGLPWELTKMSFVVDWFTNVGDVIYANVPRVGIESPGGIGTIKDIERTVYSGSSVTPSQPATYACTGAIADVCEVETKVTSRSPRQDGASIVIRSDFRLDNFTRATDAISLVIQQLRQVTFN